MAFPAGSSVSVDCHEISLSAFWAEGVFSFKGENRLNVPLSIDTDCYFLYPEHGKNLKKVLGIDFNLPDYTLVFRDNDEEYIFLEADNFLRVKKPDKGEVEVIGRVNKPKKYLNIDFKAFFMLSLL